MLLGQLAISTVDPANNTLKMKSTNPFDSSYSDEGESSSDEQFFDAHEKHSPLEEEEAASRRRSARLDFQNPFDKGGKSISDRIISVLSFDHGHVSFCSYNFFFASSRGPCLAV